MEQLSQTRYTQPCMVAFAIGVTDLLSPEGIRPAAAAGPVPGGVLRLVLRRASLTGTPR